MKFYQIEQAFEYYKSRRELFAQFDANKNPLVLRILIYGLLGYNFFKLHLFTALFLKRSFGLKEESRFTSFVFSKNQYNVLNSLRFYNVDTVAVLIGGIKPTFKNDIYISNRFLFSKALSEPNVGKLLAKSFRDPILRRNIPRVLKLIGCYGLFNDFMKSDNAIMNFNDHTCYNVLLASMAKENKRNSIYIQHASVSDKFPPLYHDYNLLFSEDSRNKYKQISNVRVDVLFDLRIAAVVHKNRYNSDPDKNTILICTNLFDEPEKVSQLIELLPDKYHITLRPHPRDHRKEWSQLGCLLSAKDSIWDDLNKVFIVIANESAVMLEAIFYNRLVYKAAFFSFSMDNYDYLKKGLLLKEYHDALTLKNAIISRSMDYDKNLLSYFIGDLTSDKERVTNYFNSIPSK